MELRVLCVGDVYGKSGVDFISRRLWGLRKEYNADFTVVNGENCVGNGLTPANARQLYDAGADVITLGNHGLGQRSIADFLDDDPNIVRPANWPAGTPGRGMTFYNTGKAEFCVINLIGRISMAVGPDNPFAAMDNLLEQALKRTKNIIVDFHAEATSEKVAMGYYIDGRASVLFGTHTHIQTADERIFKNGLGYLTDIGMTGVIDSIIGMDPVNVVATFRGDMLKRAEEASGPAMLCGALFTLDGDGKCTGIERVQIK